MANIKSLMTKKELEIIEAGAPGKVKFHTAARLKKYVQLTRKLRDKYRDLTQRQKVAQKPSQNLRTLEKAKVFEKVLGRYQAEMDGQKDL